MFMCCEQNAKRNHNVKIGSKSFECIAKLRYLETTIAKLYSWGSEEETELRKCVLPFGPKSFAFQVAIEKCKD